jgi:hypothetical protein
MCHKEGELVMLGLARVRVASRDGQRQKHVPTSDCLVNVPAISVTFDTSHDPMYSLNENTAWNRYDMSVI